MYRTNFHTVTRNNLNEVDLKNVQSNKFRMHNQFVASERSKVIYVLGTNSAVRIHLSL